MIRTFRPTDVVRLPGVPLLGAPNLVRTLDRIKSRSGPLSSTIALFPSGIVPNRDRCLRVLEDEGRPGGLVVGRMRSGPRAWEVEYLHLAPGAESRGGELLEGLCGWIGERGGRRVFLRLPADSPLTPVIGRSGFIPAFRETLLERDTPWEGTTHAMVEGLSAYRSNDDWSLYHLFLTCTPASVRSACALTLEEWRDFRERLGGGGHEWLLRVHEGARDLPDQGRRGSEVRAWVRSWWRHGTGCFQILVAPGEPSLPDLVQHTLASLSGKEPLLALVPYFQDSVVGALRDRGFRPVEEFCVFVMDVTARVREVGLVPAGT